MCGAEITWCPTHRASTAYVQVPIIIEQSSIIRERLGNPRLFVFSDDWLWCREHLAIEDAVLVDANGPEAVVDERN